MILRIPEYCKSFRCIADKCHDSCCIGWEISIDEKTADYYKSIGNEFGNKLKKCISHKNTFILDKNERCPFLNESNLCEIIINLGEDNLCHICNDHPRYYEWFEGIKEGGIGLCCEEAARIILSHDSPMSFIDIQIDDEQNDYYDPDLYKYLYNAREIIIAHIQNDEYTFSQRMCSILDFVNELQARSDNCEYIIPELRVSEIPDGNDLKGIFEFLLTLEPIDENWKPYLKSKMNMYILVKSYELNPNSPILNYLQNIAVYFVWRYFLKGVFDEEFLSRIKLMVMSIAVIAYLFVCCEIENDDSTIYDYAEIAKNFSKEIEYNEENLCRILDSSYELDCFSIEKLKGLFYGGRNENCKSC